MQSFYLSAAINTLVTVIICRIFLPQLIKLSPALKLVDMPNERKSHYKPIPAIGGIVIVASIVISSICSQSMRTVLHDNFSLSVCLIVMFFLGTTDDRLDIPPALRFIVQAACAFVLANQDIRIESLHGIMGINELPVFIQYILTVLIIVGATNAFNLIDGIDGLAGSIAIVNIVAFSILCALSNMPELLLILLPVAGALSIFLWYNWRPAKLFLGDGGSLVIGFFMAACAVLIVEHSYNTMNTSFSKYTLITVSASFIIPVADVLRLFVVRRKEGRSAFSADRNHLHHLLLRLSLCHAQATIRILKLHIFVIILSVGLVSILPVSVVFLLQVLLVAAYTSVVHFTNSFIKWYRTVKKMENM